MNSKKYVLIKTNGYEIYYEIFSDRNRAIRQMSSEYKELNKNPLDSTEHEMSYINEQHAMLYDRGIDVYVWRIIEVV